LVNTTIGEQQSIEVPFYETQPHHDSPSSERVDAPGPVRPHGRTGADVSRHSGPGQGFPAWPGLDDGGRRV